MSPSSVDFNAASTFQIWFNCTEITLFAEEDFLAPHLPTKEELLLSLEKTDHEINKTEFEITSLRRAKLKLEQAPKKGSEKAYVRHTAQSLMQMVRVFVCQPTSY